MSRPINRYSYDSVPFINETQFTSLSSLFKSNPVSSCRLDTLNRRLGGRTFPTQVGENSPLEIVHKLIPRDYHPRAHTGGGIVGCNQSCFFSFTHIMKKALSTGSIISMHQCITDYSPCIKAPLPSHHRSIPTVNKSTIISIN